MHQPTLSVTLRDGSYQIRWSGFAEGARLFTSAVPYDPAPTPLGGLTGPEHTVPFAGKRAYFAVQAGEAEPVWAAARAVEIPSVENFRDLGGYPARDGRSVRWGRFFRSAALNGLPSGEQAVLAGMRVAQVFDFRAASEAASTPDMLPEGTAYRNVPAFTASGEAARLVEMDLADRMRAIRTRADAEPVRAMFGAVYAELPFANAAYRQVFGALDSESGLPLILHCTAGKDRTGVICALILLALGVPKELVVEDYLLSAPYREAGNRQLLAAFARMGASEAALELAAEMITVTPAMLSRALDAVGERYPAIEAFLAAEYGVDAARISHWRALHTI